MKIGRSDPEKLYIYHVVTGQFVVPIQYNDESGRVIYIAENSSIISECFDYDLSSQKGLDHLREELFHVRIKKNYELFADFSIHGCREA